jgi:hemerythrin superfamily protein
MTSSSTNTNNASHTHQRQNDKTTASAKKSTEQADKSHKTTAADKTDKTDKTNENKTQKVAASRNPHDAIAVLRADHQQVNSLFEQYENSRAADKKKVLSQQICQELTIHAHVEEEIFYPAIAEAFKTKADQALIPEAKIEHGTLKDLIAQIQFGQPGEEMFDARMTVLKEYVQHHVKEEQNELFPKVLALKGLDLEMLGMQMELRKQVLQAESRTIEDLVAEV